MSHRRSILFVLLVTLAVSTLVVNGCSTGPPTRLYVLTALSHSESMSPASGVRGMSIGVGPVELPQYVNRPQIVTGQQAAPTKFEAECATSEMHILVALDVP
jgi:uncharacterized lipoprotein YmbA